MTKLLQLRGLPASGKTTYARSLLGKKSTWKRVNKDSIRAMIDDSHWSNKNEENTVRIRDLIISEFLGRGFDVVVDDTNLASIHEKRLRELAEKFNAVFEIKFFDTDYKECVRRDAARPNSVGEKVIKRMWTEYLQPKYSHPQFIDDLPFAIIVDIDGSLSHSDQRSPYDPSLYHLDVFDITVAELADRYRKDHKIIVCSGRDEDHREETEKWLQANNFAWDHFYMRPSNDKREDSIVKQEIYETYIRNNFNVKLVVDDRPRVICMYQKLGLRTLACNMNYWVDF